MIKLYFALLLSFVLSITGAIAGGTAQEAEEMVNKAIEHVNTVGKDQAYEDFSNKAEGFSKDDLYIFVVDNDGVTLAHGGNPKLAGKNMAQLKDADGTFFIQNMIDLAKNGGGWVDYKWTNPTTKKVQNKSTYVLPIPGENAFLGCGIYK